MTDRGSKADAPCVLLVDDEPMLLECVCRTLRKEPFVVLAASSAEEALDHLRTRPVDIVVADLNMPGTSGLELLEQVRQHYPGTLRFLLTGDTSWIEGPTSGAQDVVQNVVLKPWRCEALRMELRRALDGYRARSVDAEVSMRG